MIAAALALLLAQAPPGAGWHARLGPLTQCLAGYAVAVGSAETIRTDGATILLRDGPRWLRVRAEENGLSTLTTLGEAIDSPLGRIRRVSPPYRGRSEYDSDVVYLLPGIDGGPALRVDSAAFDGSARDLALLAAITRQQAGTPCSDFQAPAWPGDRPDLAGTQAGQGHTGRAVAEYGNIRPGFPAGHEADARAFANPLSFVESSAPRCHGDPVAS